MAVYPVPAGRSSDMLLTQRLLAQMQDAQKQLLQVEQQLSSGKRIQLSSEDPSSAGRAVTLQRLLEGKVQLQKNLATSESFLNATDSALSSVADLLTHARGLAVLATDSTTSDMERKSMAMEIESTINKMLAVGNQSFRGRYLFAGTNSTDQPFEALDQFIAYSGNDVVFRTLADTSLFLETNVPGQELFGAISREVQGLDLNPTLQLNTRLPDLRGGVGVSAGSIIVSDGMHTSTVNLENAQSVGDVLRLIEQQPPEGRELRASINAHGLVIEMADDLGGSLIIRDLNGGTTAAELGIARPSGSASQPIVGEDLDPVLRLTTSLQDLLGVRATAFLRSVGPNNDVQVQARDRGVDGNGFHVQYVEDELLQSAPGITAGSEYAEFVANARAAQASLMLTGADNDLMITANSPGIAWNNVQIELDASQNLGDAAQVTFDPQARTLRISVDDSNQTTVGSVVAAINSTGIFTASSDTSNGDSYDSMARVMSGDAGVRGNTGNSGGEANTLYVHIVSGQTTANQVVAALRDNPTIEAQFAVSLDPSDSQSVALAGSRPVDVNAAGVTTGGSGSEWDQASGLQIRSGNGTHVIDVSQAQTVEDLLNILNGSDAQLLAEINGAQNGINIRSRLSGGDFSIGEYGGTTASQLGLRSLDLQTRLADLNYQQGVHSHTGSDFVIHRKDGVDLEIDVSQATTIADVLDLINNHPLNQDPLSAVRAQLSPIGNGIQLVDENISGGQPLAVSRVIGSNAVWDLGLITRGMDRVEADAGTAPLAPEVIQGNDSNPIETRGVFNSLLRLRDAIDTYDVAGMERIVSLLDADFERLNFGRAAVGARSQGVEAIRDRNVDDQIELRSTLSDEVDVDLAVAASQFAARQAAYEASLRTIASMFHLSLLDYL